MYKKSLWVLLIAGIACFLIVIAVKIFNTSNEQSHSQSESNNSGLFHSVISTPQTSPESTRRTSTQSIPLSPRVIASADLHFVSSKEKQEQERLTRMEDVPWEHLLDQKSTALRTEFMQSLQYFSRITQEKEVIFELPLLDDQTIEYPIILNDEEQLKFDEENIQNELDADGCLTDKLKDFIGRVYLRRINEINRLYNDEALNITVRTEPHPCDDQKDVSGHEWDPFKTKGNALGEITVEQLKELTGETQDIVSFELFKDMKTSKDRVVLLCTKTKHIFSATEFRDMQNTSTLELCCPSCKQDDGINGHNVWRIV